MEGEARRRDPAATSRIMSRVRNKDSQAELLLRRQLHKRGVRYRLHAPDVPGRPDIVIRSLRIAVFVDGDFWHGNEHQRRGLRRLEDLFPTNTDWWVAKIKRNVERDQAVTAQLRAQGWTVVRLWGSDVLASPDAAAERVRTEIKRVREEPHRA